MELDDVKIPLLTVKLDLRAKRPSPGHKHERAAPEDPFHCPSLWGIVREIFPTNLCKPVLFLGLFTWLASEAIMPMCSFLSHLMFEVSTSAHIVSTINFLGSVIPPAFPLSMVS
jgi:hypothetical protein